MRDADNKLVVRELIERVWNSHDAAALRDYVSPELLTESAGHVAELLAAFPDVEVTIDQLLAAEQDHVVGRLVISGTHTGAPFAGVAASCKRMTWSSIRIYRIAGGRIVESWAMQDRLGLMEQLGAVQAVGEVEWAAGPAPRPPGQAERVT